MKLNVHSNRLNENLQNKSSRSHDSNKSSEASTSSINKANMNNFCPKDGIIFDETELRAVVSPVKSDKMVISTLQSIINKSDSKIKSSKINQDFAMSLEKNGQICNIISENCDNLVSSVERESKLVTVPDKSLLHINPSSNISNSDSFHRAVTELQNDVNPNEKTNLHKRNHSSSSSKNDSVDEINSIYRQSATDSDTSTSTNNASNVRGSLRRLRETMVQKAIDDVVSAVEKHCSPPSPSNSTFPISSTSSTQVSNSLISSDKMKQSVSNKCSSMELMV